MTTIDSLCKDVCRIIAEYATSEVCVTLVQNVLNESETRYIRTYFPLENTPYSFVCSYLEIEIGHHRHAAFQTNESPKVISPVSDGFFNIGHSLYYCFDFGFEKYVVLVGRGGVTGDGVLYFQGKPNGKQSKQILARVYDLDEPTPMNTKS